MNCISSMFTAAAGAAGLGSTLENLWSGRSKAGGSEVGWAGGGGEGAWSGWWITGSHPVAVCGAHVWKGGAPTAGDQPCRHIGITIAIC